MELFKALSDSLIRHGKERAFCINGTFHSYDELCALISRIRAWVRASCDASEQNIGMMAHDDLHTYATILALWLEGKSYVPISAGNPPSRNQSIIDQAGIRTVLTSSPVPALSKERVVRTDELPDASVDLRAVDAPNDANAFILFTSGTTGLPKGVPIARGNVSAFIRAFDAMGLTVDHTDRCLQMFELTFDLSVMSFLVPLLHGACVYTVPQSGIKYATVSTLLDEERLTIALMVPNMINNLRPYFDEIDCPDLRYSLFCGEALPLDITSEWSRCVPNARIFNVYGPTENTIFCTEYEFSRDKENKAMNGILSIGKAMRGTEVIVVNEDHQPLAAGETGELCLSGEQLTPGYLNDPVKNAAAFFEITHHGKATRFYRTGDLCRFDAAGDLLYLGRLDQQAKIQGYRVELTEIEHHARLFLERHNAVALAVTNATGTTTVELVVESEETDRRALIGHLRGSLPAYMIPTSIHCVGTFPLNVNGKTDRKALARLITAS